MVSTLPMHVHCSATIVYRYMYLHIHIDTNIHVYLPTYIHMKFEKFLISNVWRFQFSVFHKFLYFWTFWNYGNLDIPEIPEIHISGNPEILEILHSEIMHVYKQICIRCINACRYVCIYIHTHIYLYVCEQA